MFDCGRLRVVTRIQLDPSNSFGANCVCFLTDGKTLASAGHDGVVHLWNVADGVEHANTSGPAGQVDVLEFSPSGDLLASANSDGTVRLWDTVKGLQLHVLTQQAALIPADRRATCSGLKFSPDGQFVLVTESREMSIVGGGHTAALWDTRTGKFVRGFEPVLDHCVAFSPDGRSFAAVDNDFNVRLWDVATGKEQRRLSVAGGHFVATFSPDGHLLVTVGDKIRVWRVATGVCLKTLEVKAGVFPPPWFSADGSMLFISTEIMYSPDGSLNLFSGGQPIEVIEFATCQSVLALDTAVSKSTLWLQGNCQSPNCRTSTVWLVPHSFRSHITSPGTCRFLTFDLATGKNLGGDIEYGNDFAVAQFSPDGRQLALGYKDGRLLLCKPPPLPSPRPLPSRMTRTTLQRLWQELAGTDAKAAYQARWLLSAAAKQTLPLLSENLRPISGPDANKVATLVSLLDSDSFKERELAMFKLGKMGNVAEPALLKAWGQNPTLEMRRRIELLLPKLVKPPDGDVLRTLRAIYILETIGNDEARAILASLANGAPGSCVTEAAKAAAKRIK